MTCHAFEKLLNNFQGLPKLIFGIERKYNYQTHNNIISLISRSRARWINSLDELTRNVFASKFNLSKKIYPHNANNVYGS